MDWANEAHVRLYVSESFDELQMGWQGWALFVQLLRRSDHVGLLPYKGEHDLAGLASLVRMPADVAREALRRVLETGAVVLLDEHLLVPNKLKASRSRQSDRLRARESRARRRSLANLEKIAPASLARSVTEATRSVTEATRSVTEATRSVTEATRSVTEASDGPGRQAKARSRPGGTTKAGDALAHVLVSSINQLTGRRFDPRSSAARKQGARIVREAAAAGITQKEVQQVLQLRIRGVSEEYRTPTTLLNRKLLVGDSSWLERWRETQAPRARSAAPVSDGAPYCEAYDDRNWRL